MNPELHADFKQFQNSYVNVFFFFCSCPNPAFNFLKYPTYIQSPNLNFKIKNQTSYFENEYAIIEETVPRSVLRFEDCILRVVVLEKKSCETLPLYTSALKKIHKIRKTFKNYKKKSEQKCPET